MDIAPLIAVTTSGYLFLINTVQCALQGKRQIRTLLGGEFHWLLLKHVLPRRFRRVRDFGLLHSNAKRLIQLLQVALHMAVPPPSPRLERPPVRCDHCGQAMTILIRLAQPGHHRNC